MIFGSRNHQHRLNHLEALRNLQEETAGFCSFAPSSFTPPIASVPGFEEPTGSRIPQDPRDLAPLLRQRRKHPVQPRDPGPQGPPGWPALRRQRRRQRTPGQWPQRRHRRASPTGHPRRRLQTRPARRPLPHHVPQLTSPCPNRKINWRGFRFYVVLKGTASAVPQSSTNGIAALAAEVRFRFREPQMGSDKSPKASPIAHTQTIRILSRRID